MAQKPSIPKGTRDFGPVEMARRNYIFDTIREVFKLYGFSQIETPAMENLSTLMGKYGEEGDKLLFKILNSGNWPASLENIDLQSESIGHLTSKISEKGLRYDLTVPFARFVVQHRNELTMPFKRYQIQPVWRADRPQKGRYREFYQCDADVVGSDSLINEIELISLIDEVFSRLGINITIKLNNRKVLSGIAELVGQPDKLIDITVAIDKIDKIGIENVKAELSERGISEESIERLIPILEINGSTQANIELDVSLARGLNYYTGTIIEVKAKDVAIGSITGGGRYDNLTGVFGMPGLSGVGISFGADRIYDVLNALDLYPDSASATTRVMFTNFGKSEADVSMKYLKLFREAGISAEIYPDAAKMKKQMQRANDLAIPFVAIVGEEEMKQGLVTLKNMADGSQKMLTVDDAIAMVK